MDIEMPSIEEIESGSLTIDQQANPNTPSLKDRYAQDQNIIENYESSHELDDQSSVEEVEEQPVVSQAAESKESDQHRNFRELRLAKERAEQEARQLAQEREHYMKLLLQYEQQKNQQKPVETQSSFSIDDDALVEGRHVKQYHQELNKIREEMEKVKNEYRESLASQSFKLQCPDYDKVVNPQTLSDFERLYPQESEAILLISDKTKQKMMAYNLLKRYGVYKDPVHNTDHQKVAMHSKQPLSSAAVGAKVKTSPLSQASSYANDNMPSEAEAKRLVAEMFAASGNRYF